MRSSILQLASFQLAVWLATAPVRLICLVNPHLHVNQFDHSLYPRTPPLRNLLEGINLPFFKARKKALAYSISRDATGQHIHFAFGPVMPDGCVCFANSEGGDGIPSDLPVKVTVSNNSVENCISACEDQGEGYTVIGVENGTECCTCFTS
jgi:hypothetical protein